jgi:hypothetical protein
MKKIATLNLILFCSFFIAHAQLNKLCPISSTVYDKKKIQDVNLLLTTKDFVSVMNPKEGTKLTSTVQLVKATAPFPPLWFQMGDITKDAGGNFIETSFLLDARIQESNGNLTYFSSHPNAYYGSVSLDTASLQPVDSTYTYENKSTDTIRGKIDLHDYQVDKNGNKLITNQVQRQINAKCLSGLDKDTIRFALVNDIIILNKYDSIIFKWNPLDHFTPCEMIWEYKDASLSYGDVINWSHVNSVRFANDGNLIYSFRHIGLGKIDIKTGAILWKFGGKDSTNAIPVPANAGYYLQHDFMQRKDGLYSVFSNGDHKHDYFEGLVYNIDEINKKATLVSRYRPQIDTFSKALGSYDCLGDICIIDFGMYFPSKVEALQEMAHMTDGDKIVAKLSAPTYNYSYQIHQTKWAALQRRPKVTLKKNILISDNKPGLYDYTWYKIENTNAIPVAKGNSFTPSVSGKYVVEATQGNGLFKSYLISDVITFTQKKKKK